MSAPLDDSKVIKWTSMVDAAAIRLGLCSPRCRLATLADSLDAFGERTIMTFCGDHGQKSVTFQTARLG